MSTAVAERGELLVAEVVDLRRRLTAVEQELVVVFCAGPTRDPKAALARLRAGWSRMSAEEQSEATSVFEEVERQSRAARVDD